MIQAENADRVVELIRLEKISVIQILWSPTGDWIVDAGARALSIIDADTLKVTASINLGNEIPKAIAVTADAKRIFVLLASSIKVFDLETRDEIKTIGIQGGANSMAVTQDGTRIALGMLDNKMILLDSESGSVLRSLRSNYGGWSVAFSPDGKYVAAGTSQGVLMWETETGTWLPVDSKQTDLIKTLVFSHDGKKMSGGSRDAFYVWDVETGKELNRFSGTFGDVNTISFSPDDQLLLSGSADFIVRLWDLQSATEIMKYKSHTSTVFSTAFSPEGEYFVSGANEGVIRKWGVP
jgi:WD40 repeat protein